jgi:hypothetical protein
MYDFCKGYLFFFICLKSYFGQLLNKTNLMMKKITLLLAILLVNLGFAQTLPFDFSDPIHAMTGADGAVVTVVQDNGNDVLQIVGNGGDWDNAQINFAENLDLSDDANNTISFRIKAVNGTGSGNHALKFENGTTGDTELTFSISGTEWTDISLDFPAGLGSYGRMVIFTDFGGSGGGLSDTYLVDDISGAFHSTPVLPNLPFDFSSDEQLMTGAEGAVVTIVQDNGNDVLQMVGSGADWDNAQINFQDNLDLSDDSNNTITFRVKPVNGTGSGNHLLKFENGPAGIAELPFNTTGTDWQDISLDFGAGLNNYGRMVIFTDAGGDGGGLSDTYLFDDIAGATHLNGPPDLPNLPFDFSSANQLMNGDGGAVVTIEQDNGNDVLQIVGATAAWDNAQITFAENLDLSDDATNTISFRIKPINGTGSGNHLLKFEQDSGGGNEELPFSTTGTDWQDVYVDFPADATTYGKMIIFTDAGDDNAGVSDTYQIDDIAVGANPAPPSANSVTVATSQAWNGYVNAFNVSDDSYAFGFSYGAADLRATATATSMTLEPNIAIWTAEATNASWFDQGAATQTANKYIEASSYIEDNTLAGSDLTFTGNVSVSDLGSEYTVVAFVKALDPNNGYATVVNNTADISSTGDFSASATAAELASGYIIQYGFAVTGPLADPADTTLGSVVIGENAPPPSGNSVTVATSQAWNGYVNAFNLDDSYAFGFSYGAADLRATATATSMTLEPNIAIWTAEATNASWFDQGAATQTANKYIEASSYIEDNTLAGSDLTFTGNVSVSDLGSEYTVVAFVKALDPNSGYATVVNNTADISSTGDFTASATAAELASGYVIQYGFAVTGPLADPADTTLGSVVIGEATAGVDDNSFVNVSVYPNPSNSNWNFRTGNTVITSVEVFNLLGKRVVSQNNNSTEIAISTQGLTSGIYIARITTEQGVKSVKLIRE